jgi:hypothetical protein
MAEQSGIHQLRGKVRGMSYYRQKGVDEGLARSINQGLSKRVKEDAAYENTRLNSQEFGAAGSFAGACVRAISERQRTMLKDFATGALAKVTRDIIIGDSTNPWGDRQLVGADWQAYMLQVISTFAKIDFNGNVGGVWDVTVEGQTWTPNAELPAGWGTQLAAQGVNGAMVEMYAYGVELLDLGGKTRKAISNVALIGSDDVAIGESGTITEAATVPAEFTGVQAANKLQGVLVVVKPYQTVNSTKYIRQELCTFALFEPTVG